MGPKMACRIFRRMLPVCSAEKRSVEKSASTQTQSSVGNHARSLRETGTGPGSAVELKSAYLFQPVVRRFTRDYHVVHMAFTQAGAADADEARLLLQLGNRLGAAITHAGTQSADQLKNHLRQRAAIRHAALDAFGHEFTHPIAAAVVAHGHGVSGRILQRLRVALARAG